MAPPRKSRWLKTRGVCWTIPEEPNTTPPLAGNRTSPILSNVSNGQTLAQQVSQLGRIEERRRRGQRRMSAPSRQAPRSNGDTLNKHCGCRKPRQKSPITAGPFRNPPGNPKSLPILQRITGSCSLRQIRKRPRVDADYRGTFHRNMDMALCDGFEWYRRSAGAIEYRLPLKKAASISTTNGRTTDGYPLLGHQKRQGRRHDVEHLENCYIFFTSLMHGRIPLAENDDYKIPDKVCGMWVGSVAEVIGVPAPVDEGFAALMIKKKYWSLLGNQLLGDRLQKIHERAEKGVALGFAIGWEALGIPVHKMDQARNVSSVQAQ